MNLMRVGGDGKSWAISPWLCGVLLLWSAAGQAATYTVGTASGTCASPTQATIAAAIAAAAASAATPHTIRICPGTYNESGLTLNNARHNGITITSTTASKADVTVAAGAGTRAFDINGRSSVVLSQLTITGNNQGIYVQNWTNGVTLDNLSITTGAEAVETNNVQNFKLTNATLVANNDGLDMEGDAGGVNIDNVTITAGTGGTDSGIEIAKVYGALSITRVTVTRAGYDGIQVANGNSLTPTLRDLNLTATRHGIYANNLRLDLGVSTLAGNTISAGQRGIWLTGDTGAFQVRDTSISAGTGSTDYHGILATGAYSVWSVRRVTVSQAGGDGINVTGGSAPVIEDVAITATRDGIVVADGNGPIVQKSVLARNSLRTGDRGVYFSGSIGNFRVYDSEIWAGTNAATDHGIHAAETWSDYRIERNIVRQAGGRGIYVEGDSSNGVISSNLIENAAVEGLRLGRNVAWSGATVSNNCFYNVANAYNNYRSANWYTGTSGNYWGSSPAGSGYSDTCTDTDANGVCDTAYAVPGASGASMPRYDNYPLKTCALSVPAPTTDYRFDECAQYTGATGEVVDTAGSSPGTPMAGLQNATPGQIQRYADFSSADKYVNVPAGPALSNWTISVWFKTPFAGSATHSSRYYVIGSVSGGGDFLYLDRSSSGGAYRWGVYTSDGGTTDGTFRFSTLANGWHQMVLVGNGSTTSLYIDGSYRDQVSRKVTGTFRYLGTSYDNAGSAASGQSFGTPLDEFKVFNTPLSAFQITTLYANELASKNWDGSTRPSSCVAGPHHIRVYFDNSGALTCAPRTVSAIACADANCTARYSADVSVTLSPNGGAATIPANGTGTPSVSQTIAGTPTVGLTASTPATTGVPALRCWPGTIGTPGGESCNLEFADTGFFVSVPHHASCTTQTLTLTAAKTDDVTKKCVPAFDGVSRDIKLRFAYVNPVSGTIAPTVGSADPPATALATASDQTLSLAFTAGVATTNFRYRDAGSLQVSASYSGSAATGDAGLAMTTASNPAFVVAPASFVLSDVPAPPLVAGTPFNVTVTAKNSCNETTQNFGQESPTAASAQLTSSNPVPGIGNATAINQTVSGFASGAKSVNVTWNEVGTIDLAATTSDYLGSGLNATGSLAGVGRFQPAYFDTIVTPGCGGAFTYAGLAGGAPLDGQAFTVQVKAKRAGADLTDGTNTANYAGAAWAKTVTLSDVNAGTGTLANGSLADTAFANGMASRADVRYRFAVPTAPTPAKNTPSYILSIRAIDADTPAVSSSGHAEGSTVMRSGRVRLTNAYGSPLLGLPLPTAVEYFESTANGWRSSAGDSCTALVAANFAFAFGGAGNNLAACETAVTVGGAAPAPAVTLAAPGATAADPNNGWTDITLNLGSAAAGNRCTAVGAAGPAATTANLPWLQSIWTGGAPGNPTARATFGVYKTPVIYRRENY